MLKVINQWWTAIRYEKTIFLITVNWSLQFLHDCQLLLVFHDWFWSEQLRLRLARSRAWPTLEDDGSSLQRNWIQWIQWIQWCFSGYDIRKKWMLGWWMIDGWWDTGYRDTCEMLMILDSFFFPVRIYCPAPWGLSVPSPRASSTISCSDSRIANHVGLHVGDIADIALCFLFSMYHNCITYRINMNKTKK